MTKTPTIRFSEPKQRWIVTYWNDDGKRRRKRFDSEDAGREWLASSDLGELDESAPVVVDPVPSEPIDTGRLVEGVEISVPGEGRFKFRRIHEPDGSLTCWGPVNSRRASWRSFRPEQVRTIHRKAKARSSVVESEAA